MDPARKVELEAYSRRAGMDAALGHFDSPVQRFYCGATVLVTGGSGFMGKQLVEKLFRACKLKKMYILIRKKKGKGIGDRLQAMLADPVFDSLREKQPDFTTKLVPVEGDASQLKLGIAQQPWDVLAEEVNVIFHMAATVRFDEPLRAATIINVRGTREALVLAGHCKHLKKFVHVSTAFAQATIDRRGQKIYEEFDSVPVPPDVMISLAETVQEARLKNITPSLVGEWPNTYTFTKAIAEEEVRRAGAQLPVCIVRPAIVICSYTEPCPGWVDVSSVFGPSGIVLGIGIGALRTFFVDVDVRLHLVPVDLANNAVIAAAWDSSRPEGCGRRVPIYTVASEEATVQWRFFWCFRSEEFRRLLSPKTIWYPYMVDTGNRGLFWVMTWLLHYIPAYVGDAVVALFRIRLPEGVPSFVKVYDKVAKFTAIYNYFLTSDFHFQDGNLRGMVSRMSERDRAIFDCDQRRVDKKQLLKIWCVGLRRYIVRDGLQGSEEAYRRQFYFKIANHAVILLYIFVFCTLLMFIFKLMSFVSKAMFL